MGPLTHTKVAPNLLSLLIVFLHAVLLDHSHCKMSGAGETVPGEGGLPKVIVHHDSGATAEVYLYGGQLMSYKTPNGQEVLFRSSKAVYDGKKAMRGGIPICFPQFAAQGKSRTQQDMCGPSSATGPTCLLLACAYPRNASTNP